MSTLTLKNNTSQTLIKNQKSIQSKPIVGTFVWIGGTSTSWSTPSNWLGGVVPGVNDTAYFDGHRSVRNCDIDAIVNVKGVRIQNFYSGTITHGNFGIVIGTEGWYQDGGRFIGNQSSFFAVVDGFNGFVMEGGYFYQPNTFSIAKISSNGSQSTPSVFSITQSALFEANILDPSVYFNVIVSNSLNISLNTTETNTILRNVSFQQNSSCNIIINGVFKCIDLFLSGTSSAGSGPSQLYGGTIKVTGNISVNSKTLNPPQGSAPNYSTASIELIGTGNQTIGFSSSCGYDGKLPSIVVNKTSGTLILDPSYPINVLPSWNVVSCPSLSATGSTLRVFKKFNLDDYQSFEASTPLTYNDVEFYTVGTESFYLTSNLTCNNWYGDNKNSQYGGGCIRSVAGQKIYVKGNHTLALTNGGGGAGYTGWASNTINDETVFQMIGDGTSSTKTLYGSTSGNCITALEINNPTGITLVSGDMCVMGGIKQLNGALNFSTDSTVTVTSVYSRLRYIDVPSATFQNLNIHGTGGAGGALPGIYVSGGSLNVAKNLSVDAVTIYNTVVSGDPINVSGNIYMGQYLTNITNQINHVGTTTATISHNNSSANKITGLINKTGSGTLTPASNISRFNSITISNGTFDLGGAYTVTAGEFITTSGNTIVNNTSQLSIQKLILSGGTLTQSTSSSIDMINGSYSIAAGLYSNNIAIKKLNFNTNGVTISVSGTVPVVNASFTALNSIQNGKLSVSGDVFIGNTVNSVPYSTIIGLNGNNLQKIYALDNISMFSLLPIEINQQSSGSVEISGKYLQNVSFNVINAPSFKHYGVHTFAKNVCSIASSAITFNDVNINTQGDLFLSQNINTSGTLTFYPTTNSLNGNVLYGTSDFVCYGNVILQKAANNYYPSVGGNVNLVMCGNNKDQYITYTQANSAIGPGDLIINHSGSGQVYLSGGTGYANNSFRTQSLILSSGTFNLSGNDLYVNGNIQFSGGNLVESGNKTINVASGWIMNSGTFTPSSSGLVNLYGTNQSIQGSTTFSGLKKAVTTSRTLTFDASSTTTVSGALTLSGASGQPLLLRSSSTGTQWKIAPNGARNIGFLNVQDSNNLVPPNLVPSGSVNNGNNTGWF